MKRVLLSLGFGLSSFVLCSGAVMAEDASAPAAIKAKTCDDLKSGIDAKLQGKGVKGYTLDIVAADAVQDARVVGSCEGGKKKVTYKKG